MNQLQKSNLRRPSSRGPCLTAVLRMAGLRPTRQRLALADLIYGSGHRHVSAEALHAEADQGGVAVSLATVYNTLRQFKDAGLVAGKSRLMQPAPILTQTHQTTTTSILKMKTG